METLQIFFVQFAMSIVCFALVARWHLAPRLAGRTTKQALAVLMVPHAFRYIGLAFEVPPLVGADLRGEFARAAAYGDFATSLLAILALFALRGDWRFALPLAWLTNVVGTVDLANALRQVDAVPQLGVVWFIPTFVVPALLVSHFMAFQRLLAHAHARRLEPTATEAVAGQLGA